MLYQTQDEMLGSLGESLRSARLAQNLSQQTVAVRSGVSMTALRNLEAGRNASTSALLSVCRTLRQTDWIEHIAPPELNDALFDRPEPGRKRLRAARQRKEIVR